MFAIELAYFKISRSFPLQREQLKMDMELKTVRRCVSKFNVAISHWSKTLFMNIPLNISFY